MRGRFDRGQLLFRRLRVLLEELEATDLQVDVFLLERLVARVERWTSQTYLLGG